MSKATICDKCGKILEYAPDCKITIYYHPYGDTDYDLCEECAKSLKEWLKLGQSHQNERKIKNET